MLVNSGKTLIYRGIAHYENEKQKKALMDHIKGLKNKACAFDNTVEADILVVDFELQADRDNFNRTFGRANLPIAA
jgi:hypothetical protein